MFTVQTIHSHPLMEHVTNNDATVKTIYTEQLQHCFLCGFKTNSLYIYNFNLFLCDPCFKFALSCTKQ